MKSKQHSLRPPSGLPHEPWNRLSFFTQRVYLAACSIPKGQTRSYQWVARQAGFPKAVRAVGNALNRNPFAPRVPCHRVIRSDGSLGGFAGGSRKKQSLLRREGALSKRIILRNLC